MRRFQWFTGQDQTVQAVNPSSLLRIVLPAFLLPGAHAQYWGPLGNGIPNIIGDVRVVYGDTIWDRLLTGSPASWIINGPDTLTIAGVAQWDGAVWDTLPSRLQSVQGSPQNGCAPVYGLFRYREELYANGYFGFTTPSGEYNYAIARWDTVSDTWEALECLNPNNGMLTMLHVPPTDTMYFTGYRSSICGYPESCVFEYDGAGFYPFEPYFAWPGIPEDDYVGYVFRFQGELYMTGLLNSTVTGDFYGFLKYNGLSWDTVPGFSTSAPIKNVLIHDEKLYVCGYFFTNTGAPGNLVTVFDGQQWSDMGGGLRWALPNSTSGNAYDLHEWNGDIYVAGQFNYAGGVPAKNVARWNGHQWCGMGGEYTPPGAQAFSVTDWRDTLYIAGGFTTIDGDTMNNVAKWLGQVEYCSPSVGIEEAGIRTQVLIPILLDATGLWQLKVPEGAQVLRLYNAQGRLVREERLANQQTVLIDLSGEPSGFYALSCTDSNGMVRHAKIFAP